MTKAAGSARFNPRVYAVVACGLAAALLVISILPIPSLPSPVPSEPITPLRTIPDTDVNPFGGNFFLDWEVEPWKVEKTLQMAKDAGLGWANLHFVWEGLEPRRGRYRDDRLGNSTWDKFDLIVSVAEKHGLKIIARLDRPPAWTRTDNSLPERPPDNFEDYGDFVEAVATRYRGRISHYQIWNEPNIFPEWGNQAVDPAGYVRLLKIAYQRIKRVDPNARVLTAPLAQTTEVGPQNLNEMDFLDAMYRAGAQDYFDILYANGYGFDRAPEDPPSPDKLNFARVSLLRQVMERNGDANKAVWFHEFGWNASPDAMPKDKLVWRRVSEQEQADFTVRAIRKARAEWPWAGVFSIWYFRQDGHIAQEQSEYYFRMVDPGFTPRLVYYAVASAAKDYVSAGPGTYQETNPALTYDDGWREEMQGVATGGAWLVGSKAGQSVTVKFRGTDFAIVVAKVQQGARLLVTVDGRAANMLESGGEGRSYLDLASAVPQLRVRVPVATGLPYGPHVVRLAIAPERDRGGDQAIIDGFEVAARAQTSPLIYVGGAAAAVFLGVALLLVIRRRAARAART